MDTLHTGGAIGGDIYWEKIAKNRGHCIKIYHYDGHKHTRVETSGEERERLIEHSIEEKLQCENDLKIISKYLKKDIPDTDYKKYLLERDWNMVMESNATSLYALGRFVKDESRLKISGGTGWIVEMFVDYIIKKYNINIAETYLSFKPLSVYFTNLENNMNYQLCVGRLNKLTWERVEQFPEPEGNWIGIGSRNLKN